MKPKQTGAIRCNDPEGDYIRQWIPSYTHEAWDAGEPARQAAWEAGRAERMARLDRQSKINDRNHRIAMIGMDIVGIVLLATWLWPIIRDILR